MIPGCPILAPENLYVVPGYQQWTSPGTYYFVVPPFNQIDVQLIGAGGAGGFSFYGAGYQQTGNPGFPTTISALSLYAGAGQGGIGGGGGNGTGGAAGVAYGGDVNLSGVENTLGYGMNTPGPYGGTGGSPDWLNYPGDSAYATDGTWPGAGGGGCTGNWNYYNPAGGGGAGAYLRRTVLWGQVFVGATLTIVVGSGGAGLYDTLVMYPGYMRSGAGANGFAQLSWS